MTNQIQIFKSKEYGKVRGYADNNGTVFINVTDVAHGLGFINKNGNIRLNKINRMLKSFNYGVEVNGDDFIPENMFYRLAMKADNEAANNFQAYLADQVIPSIRRTGSYSVNPVANNFSALPSPDVRQDTINNTKSFQSIIQNYTYYAYNQGDRRGHGNTFKDYSGYIFAKFMRLANDIADIQTGYRPTSDNEKQFRLKTIEANFGYILLRGMYSDKHFTNIESEISIKADSLKKDFSTSLPLLNKSTRAGLLNARS